MITNPHKISLLFLAISATLAIACDDKKVTTDDMAEEISAGEMVGGEMVGGEMVGGEMVGGEMTGGEMTGGEMTGGDITSDDPCQAMVTSCDGHFDPPPPMNEHTGTYADDEGILVIFGGNTSVPENCGFPAYTGESKTYLYYDRPLASDCGPWVELNGGPQGRARHSADYGEGSVWMFGGRVRAVSMGPYHLFNDLWRFDVATRTWMEVPVINEGPSGRYNSSITYDSTRRTLWVYGGNVADNTLNPDAVHDLWMFDIETSMWTEIETPEYLLDRMWHNAIYDPIRDRLVFFGGADESAFFDAAVYFNDLVFYNPESDSWGRAEPDQAPDGRFWSQMVYRMAGDEYLIFGGHDDQTLGNRNDSWSYNPETNVWSALTGEDTYNRPANGFCDFPPDFTIVDRNLPERRNAHSFSWSNTCDRGLMFGGKTDCGAINDVWAYTSESGWENSALATAGEVCHRWRSNPENCANMCF